jgi:hypothetical protein
MKRPILWATLSMALVVAATDIGAANRNRWLAATLEPRQEVPAVASPASGTFLAVLDEDARELEYWLTFEDLQASITQSHIHFAQPNVNGAIVIWLCGTGTGATQGPAGTQVCPQEGTITGVIRPENVIAATTQGISAGDFDKVIDHLRKGFGYANIHTAQSPGGEIRGQLISRRTSRR